MGKISGFGLFKSGVFILALLLSACGSPEGDSKQGVSTKTAGSSSIKSAGVQPAAGTQQKLPAQSESKAGVAVGSVNKIQDCTLTMGWDPWEPYQYRDRSGEVSGLDIDIIREAVKRTGCSITFKEAGWAMLLKEIRSGEIDMVAGASVTESRKKFAYFSEPYRVETWVLYVRAEDAAKYAAKSMKQLLDGGLRIGTVTDYVYGETVAEYRDNPQYEKQFIGSEVGEENFALLADHKIDAILEDPFVGIDVIRRKGLRKMISRLPLVLHSGNVNIMFARKMVSRDKVDAIDDALAVMRADGTYRRILKMYSE